MVWQSYGSQEAAGVISVQREQILRECLGGHLAATAKVNPPHPGEIFCLWVVGLLPFMVGRRKKERKKEKRRKAVESRTCTAGSKGTVTGGVAFFTSSLPARVSSTF